VVRKMYELRLASQRCAAAACNMRGIEGARVRATISCWPSSTT
jgi:hypothetical protein